ncbi:hypothetical protein EYZ11_009460 [Aspergillus tanneri]|uniref:Uncharacterized protein n=1 Tax=Aspergillus tanneri TaxID=1220188 RepID=A0A4S3J8B4_9EURO|nr:uncharacterized protein ATNIH1004_000792 [Aspergillus tanneri]KAA8651893.1 hypothetical protein ATNIH1004_000792 [Aspergillus tanneri]THC91075.1 hypothetical protein EYZ11_009460 [Aspergillus tanneri]
MVDAQRKRPQSVDRLPPSSATSPTQQPRAQSDLEHARRQISPPRAGSVANGAPPVIASDDDDRDEDDFTSSSGSNTSEDESDEDNDEQAQSGDGDVKSDDGSLPHISGCSKPLIRRVDKDPGLMARLSAFLPQIRSANEDLQREIDAGRGKNLRLDEVDELHEGRYIEMNLGLGVLEEQHSDDHVDKSDGGHTNHSESSSKQNDSNNLEKLMGKNEEASPSNIPTIEEL